ncbi:MAG: hypothetical protein IJW79_04660 [Clostridia bacterium]|nr:hypothetical protein [Clostridia bacterium]
MNKNISKAAPYGLSAIIFLALLFAPVFSDKDGQIFSLWSLFMASVSFFGNIGGFSDIEKVIVEYGEYFVSMITTYGIIVAIFTAAISITLIVACVLSVLKFIRTCSNDDAIGKNSEVIFPMIGFLGYIVVIKLIVPLIFNTAIGRKAPETQDSVCEIISYFTEINACDSTTLSVVGYIVIVTAIAAVGWLKLNTKKNDV